MLIHPQTTRVKWTGPTKKHYLSKGYNFTKMFEEFDVDILDLPAKSETKVKLTCDECDDIFELRYSRITKRKSLDKDYCPNCSPRTTSDKNAITCRIRKEFSERSLKLSDDVIYTNQRTRLSFTCKVHANVGVQFVSYEKFKFANRGCRQCGEENRLEQRKIPFDRIVSDTESRGFLMLSEGCVYSNNKSKLLFLCRTHGEFKLPWVDFQFSKHGCPSCAIDCVSGENHFNWCDGVSSINSYIRGRISPWIKESYKNYDNKCFVTGDSVNLELHHPYNFHKIVKEVFRILPMEIKRQISDYTDVELTQIKETALKLHFVHGLGVPLRKDIHKEFHKKYGNTDNTFEQLLEFREEYQ